MKREEFERLSTERQVDIFNKIIEEQGSLNKASKFLNIPKTTIRENFAKHGYIFDSESKKYVKNTNTSLNNKTSPIEPANENKGSDINMLDLEQLVNNLVEKKFKELLKENPIQKDIELSSKCEGSVIYRTFGVYDNVLNEVMPWIKKQRFTAIEIVSQALLDFKKNHE